MSAEGDKPTTKSASATSSSSVTSGGAAAGGGASATAAATTSTAGARKKKKKKGGGGRRAARGTSGGGGGGGAPYRTPAGAPDASAPVPWWAALAGAIVLGALTVWAWPPRPAPEPHVERGNGEYAQRRYREALGEYEGAPGNGPRNAGVQLDRGLARFRLAVPPPDASVLPMLPPDASAPEGLSRAQDELRTAARGGTTNAAEDVDALLRARAAYNLGNTLFAQHGWDNAIDAYKEALRLRPGFREAAWNLELARRLREAERNPPDAGPDASPDATPPPDAGDAGSDGARPDGGGARDSGAGGDGGNERGDGGNNRGDGGAPQQPDAGAGGNDGGAGNEPDAGAPPQAPDGGGPPPRSMAPLDDLDRTSRSLQNELMRRRGITPRGPDDDR